jgi:flagellin
MTITVNTNIPSVAASRHLVSATAQSAEAMSRLASGLRINGASDDAAGLTVATRMRADIASLNQALRNVNDAISMIGVYLGAADEIEKIFVRGRELAVQALNDTYTQIDRENAQIEYQAIVRDEIFRIKSQTTFNTLPLADNHLQVSFQVGVRGGDSISLTFPSLNVGTLMNGPPGNLSEAPLNGDYPITALDEGLRSLNEARTRVAAFSNRLEYTAQVLMRTSENTQSALSRVTDADYAAETAALARSSVLTQAASAMLAQTNQTPQYALTLLR